MATLLIRRIFYISIILSTHFFLSNCTKDKNEPNDTTPLNEGFFILCEGNFNWGNASISNYNITNDVVELQHNYFKEVNGYDLGDIAQSIYEMEDVYAIVVNNSSKVELVNKSDFNVLASITDLGSPRYFLPINDSIAYVSDLLNNKIHILNYQTANAVGEIAVNGWSEQMQMIDDSVYVSLYSSQSIGVINVNTHEPMEEISLDLAPLNLEKDKNGKLWVIGSEFGGQSKLYRINPVTKNIEMSIVFEAEESLSFMDIYPDSEYIHLATSLGTIYKMNILSTNLPDPLVSVALDGFYGMNVDKDGDIYLCEANDFVQNGLVTKLNSNGEKVYEVVSGVAPNSVIIR